MRINARVATVLPVWMRHTISLNLDDTIGIFDHLDVVMRQRSAGGRIVHVLKCQFDYLKYPKARCRGLARDTAQIEAEFALVNLWMARRGLCEAQ
ncbi:hypothetical protein PTKU15_93090 [Paraburkholderia terrae]|nr:hypothetical protein PTKU15_93090 [Paraburkholderia terrae]